MKTLIYAIICCMVVIPATAQLKVGANPTTISSGAILQADASGTRGAFYLPRVTLTGTGDVTTVASPQAGFTVYNTATAGTAPNDVTPGYYYHDGTQWQKITSTSVTNSAWLLTGNAGTTAATNFMGTTDDNDVIFKRNNVQAGLLNDAANNTSWGVFALNQVTTGKNNTAVGYAALRSNTSGTDNTASGYASLYYNTTTSDNTAYGSQSLLKNTGTANTANGSRSLYNNTTGNNNTANGSQSLLLNTTGFNNTATGFFSLQSNTTGISNTANGSLSLSSNSIGFNNTASGYSSLYKSTGNNNTASGYSAGFNLTTGNNNIAIGANTNLASATADNQLNIGNTIFGTGLTGSVSTPAGKIGINNTAPTEVLDVAGNVKFSGALMPNNTAGTAGQVLISAGAGTAPVWTSSAFTSNDWHTTGNAGTTPGSNFIGTTDDQDLIFERNSTQAGWINQSLYATSFGAGSMPNSTTGIYNTALGSGTMGAATTGHRNVAIGALTLGNNTTGAQNTGAGSFSLSGITTGSSNVGLGVSTGNQITTGSQNTFIGTFTGTQLTGDATNNIIIGFNQQANILSGNDQLNIGGAIFGTGITGSAATPLGNIGIGVSTPAAILHLKAGTATAGTASLKIDDGTVLATPEKGSIEKDTKVFYGTPDATNRGIISTVSLTVNNADFTMVNGTAAQPLFTASADAITLVAGTSYEFDAQYILNTGITTHTTATLFGGTATFNSISYVAELFSSAANTTTTTESLTNVNIATVKVLNATSANAETVIKLKGIIRVNAGGTFIPQVQFSAAPGSAKCLTNSFFKLTPLGSNTVQSVGSWN